VYRAYPKGQIPSLPAEHNSHIQKRMSQDPHTPQTGTTTDGMMRYQDQRTGELINIPVHNLASKTSPYMDFTGSTSRFSKEPLDQFL
jgi:hypothetical protein